MLSRTVVNWCRISRWPQRCRCQAVKAAKSRCSHAKHMPRFHAWLTRARRPAKPHPSTPSSRPLTTPSSGTDHRLADLMLFVGTYRDEAPRVSCVSRGGDIFHLRTQLPVPVKRHRGAETLPVPTKTNEFSGNEIQAFVVWFRETCVVEISFHTWSSCANSFACTQS